MNDFRDHVLHPLHVVVYRHHSVCCASNVCSVNELLSLASLIRGSAAIRLHMTVFFNVLFCSFPSSNSVFLECLHYSCYCTLTSHSGYNIYIDWVVYLLPIQTLWAPCVQVLSASFWIVIVYIEKMNLNFRQADLWLPFRRTWVFFLVSIENQWLFPTFELTTENMHIRFLLLLTFVNLFYTHLWFSAILTGLRFSTHTKSEHSTNFDTHFIFSW